MNLILIMFLFFDMCNNPIILNQKSKYSSLCRRVEVPCNNCLGCRIDKLMLWQARCNSEYIKYRSAFVTFTYDDYNLPYKTSSSMFPTLVRLDLHKYIDNIRHKVKKLSLIPDGCCKDFHYFGCGEYGDSFQRPHYHVLFFGLDFADFNNFFVSTWKKGLVKSLPVSTGAIRYVVDYMTKNINGDMALKQYDEQDIERPFYVCSRGIGSDFFYAHKDEIASTGNVKIGSRIIPVPTYYSNLFFDCSDDNVRLRLKSFYESYQKVIQSAHSQGFSNYDDYVKYTRRANELSLSSKLHNKGIANIPSYVEI